MNKHNLVVGQTLYIKSDWSGRGGSEHPLEEYVVEKIGRVWAKLKHPYYRVNLETLALDGSRGTVWLSAEQYRQSRELGEAWHKFCRSVNDAWHRRPDHITLEGIKEARLKLGL